MLVIAFKKGIDNLSLINRLAAKSVQWWTKSEFFHVEVIIDGIIVSSTPDTGLKISQGTRIQDNDWDILYYPTKSTTNKIILDFVREEEGTKYDWFGIFFAQFINRRREDPEKWFCSELNAKILQLAGHKNFQNIEPFACTPQDVYNLLKKN